MTPKADSPQTPPGVGIIEQTETRVAVGSSDFLCDCAKSFVGRYWYATVNGEMKCSHLHRTPKAARACAREWVAFQTQVEKFKSHNNKVSDGGPLTSELKQDANPPFAAPLG